jgi:hypothetical protein
MARKKFDEGAFGATGGVVFLSLLMKKCFEMMELHHFTVHRPVAERKTLGGQTCAAERVL